MDCPAPGAAPHRRPRSRPGRVPPPDWAALVRSHRPRRLGGRRAQAPSGSPSAESCAATPRRSTSSLTTPKPTPPPAPSPCPPRRAPRAAADFPRRAALHHRRRRPVARQQLQQPALAPGQGGCAAGRKPTVHWLRHTHVVWSLQSGAGLSEIQARIGHASITTTIGVHGRGIVDLQPAVLYSRAATPRRWPRPCRRPVERLTQPPPDANCAPILREGGGASRIRSRETTNLRGQAGPL